MTPIQCIGASTALIEPFSTLTDKRVQEATQTIFERAKEIAQRIWTAVVTGVIKAGGAVSFVFFRTLDWVSPSMGLKAEVVYLRVGNLFQSIRDAWNEEERRNELETLRVQNREIREQLVGHTELVLEVNRLRDEKGLLTQQKETLEQNSRLLEERVVILTQTQEQTMGMHRASLNDRASILQERDLLLRQNESLKTENRLLQTENQSQQQTLVELTAQMADLTLQLEQAILRKRAAEGGQAIETQLAKICHSLEDFNFGQKSSLDDDLEQILPPLFNQFQIAQEALHRTKSQFDPQSAPHRSLMSLERVLGEITQSCARIPATLKLHTQWNQPVTYLLQEEVSNG